MRVSDLNARQWYMQEAASQQWDYRTLKRNIDTQYYYRLTQTPDAKKQVVIDEMLDLTADYQKEKSAGIILCAETNADVARFSTLATNKQMYAAKYLTYMPSKEELRREIERQKEIFMLRQNNEGDATA